MIPQETVPCVWCGTPTRYTGTKHCNRCHELDVRIRMDLELAEKILKHYRLEGLTQEQREALDDAISYSGMEIQENDEPFNALKERGLVSISGPRGPGRAWRMVKPTAAAIYYTTKE